jgi:hypothetical protein
MAKLLLRALSTVAKRVEPIAGTTPLHTTYILLHTKTPVKDYPAKASSTLQRSLMLSIPGASVNFAWNSSTDQDHVALPEDNGDLLGSDGNPNGDEAYTLTAFTVGRDDALRIPQVSKHNLPSVTESIKSFISTHATSSVFNTMGDASVPSSLITDHHLLVCTHGSRDCRCGDLGGSVVRALREARDARVNSAPNDDVRQAWNRIRITEVAHVGGHKYAANVLIYPQGDWYVTDGSLERQWQAHVGSLQVRKRQARRCGRDP